ncbi:hypothetical protein dsat_1284 [Alkalidesulfovibrio alkalitolerans DSM 16529]|uniref:Fibronectin type-III domain-containing protein n=1 Tax=Alkalidesulfovibrio alkalitolerans DSM 16529 TaxID=1121439 RepID=S7T0F7_9BACT|nr:TIGR03790 family protein [Alkalidesulfovibrio alkalitolerans]EPR30562.1 hypothetical protein dsat_1284 [Alkalidesulfovibrio alkalitolerans DSM 16529]
MLLRTQLARLFVAALVIVSFTSGAFAQANAQSETKPKAQPMQVFAAGGAANSDSSAELRWKFTDESLSSGRLKGVRIYRLLDGDRIGFNIPPVELVADVGMGTSLKVDGLKNGSRAIFIGRAYDQSDEEIHQAVFFAFPGVPGKERPSRLNNLYAANGATAVGVFWDPLPEINIAGYEIARRADNEGDYTVVARFPKVVRLDVERTGAEAQEQLPEIRPTMFRDSSVEPGRTYSYRVRAMDMEGNFGPDTVVESVRIEPARSPLPEEVLLLARKGSDESLRVARYYAERRGVPERNILEVSIPKAAHTFRNVQVVEAVREHLLNNGLAGKIRVIVPCRGVPLGDGRRSLDSMLMDLFDRYTWGRTMGTSNPFFGQNAHFDGSFGLYLVSRLDGPDAETAMGLVDKAIAAEREVRASSGAAYFVNDQAGQEGVKAAERHGVQVVTKDRLYTKENLIPDEIMWFFSWGHEYRKIRRNEWPVGSIAGYLKSDTLARLNQPKAGYWVQGLLEEGVTATYGAVVEPYVQGYTRGDILLDRFWGGEYTFAEAYIMATPTVRWAMSAVGDPLYKLRK